MRKVVAVELVSLDGVMESPEEWAFSYSNDEMEEANASGMAASDALLLGRVTYEQMAAYWPNQPGGVPMVDYINSVPKYVVSTTLEEPLEWNNSTLIEGDVAEEILRLKQQPGETITILGSGALVLSLLRGDLIDELRLISPDCGRREASLRGRPASAGARGLEDFRYGRRLPRLPAARELKAHPSSQSGGFANQLSPGSDPEDHPFTLDLCLVRLATVLEG
jgi:dihydrofolate reductase